MATVNSSGNTSFLTYIRNAIVTYKGTVGDPVSIADVSKIARVEPITLVSSDLTGIKDLYHVMHGILNIYAAYYLQAVSILSAELIDIRILKILDKTNPDRDLKTFLAAGYHALEEAGVQIDGNFRENLRTMSLENCQFGLPMLKSDKENGLNIASESFINENDTHALSTSISKLETFEKVGYAVGKVLNVNFKLNSLENDCENPREVSMPVVIRLDTMILPNDIIRSLTTANAEEITIGSRFKDALAGRIGFIKDFILASDLIKSQKKSMIKDPTGYYSNMLKRINNSRIYSALSGNISLAGVSSVMIISEEDEAEIQRKIGGKLTNKATREMVFNNTSMMMIVVISQSWERVSIYVRDIDGFSQNSFNDFRQMNDNDSSISDVLKAFQLNQAPSF